MENKNILKSNWIDKNVNNIIVYSNENIDRIQTGKNLKKLRELLYIKTKQINCVGYNYLRKIENGFSVSKKIIYKIVSELYDIAEKIYDEIEEILWPIKENNID